MTSADYQQLFFSTIQRAPGQSADDYEAVLGASGIPAGLGPYVVPDASMPFAAMTQQIGSDGRIAGRIFLPTAMPDDLGYYAHPFSPLCDGPTPGSLLWEFRDLGGPPVVTPIGGDPVPPAGDYQTQIDALHDRVEILEEAFITQEERLTVIESVLHEGLHAHGPVNLPIVLKDWNSLRAMGDIDVTVKPGQALPPDMTVDPPDAADLVLLKRLIGRNDEAES